ncbi:MAG: hypothetical protein AAF492_04210 [Verrucomicrobiota bacterium]
MNRQKPLAIVLAFGLAVSNSESAEARRRPVSQWIAAIQQEAAQQYAEETARYVQIRFAAGWSMAGLSGRPHQIREVKQELPLLKQWLEDEGYRMLHRLLRDEVLSSKQEPYAIIALALYLRAGLDYEKTATPGGRALLLNLDKVPGGRDDCLAYRKQINRAGRKALYNGYLRGALTKEEVNAIRLYRIAQGQQVVRESFLPAHLGLHPLDEGRFRDSPGGMHGLNNIIRLVHGRPYYDVRLRRFEAVLESERYSDKLDTPYHLTLSLRPEGVLDFLGVLEGYEAFDNEAGAKVCRQKPEHLEPADSSIRLQDRVGPKPVLLFINDPIDGPLKEQFPAFETFYQAYREEVDCWFVAVDIHDWYYSGMHDMLSRDTPGQFPNTHYHSEQERARKLKNRYLESPHATFPALIGNNRQAMKNFYGTGGGANHWVIIDRDGKIAEYTGNQNGNMNHLETAVRRILANGGRMARNSRAHLQWGNPASAPNVILPANKRMRLHNAEVVSVDAKARELTVKRDGIGPDGILRIQLKPFARVTVGEVPAELENVHPGQRVSIDFFLDDYLEPSKAESRKLDPPQWGTPRREYTLGRQTLRMTLLGRYGQMRRRWYLDTAAEARPLPARAVRVIDAARAKKPGLEPVVIWMSGYVTEVDPTTRRITVERTPITAEAATGYRFHLEAREQGQRLALTQTAKVRQAEVAKWLAAPEQPIVVLADDATDVSLNGAFEDDIEHLSIGDFVGIRYYPECQPDHLLVPHTLRITKPIFKSENNRGL